MSIEQRAPASGAKDGGPDVIGVAELRTSCETLVAAIVGEGGSREKAEAHAPGAAENADATVRGWLRYNQQLHRMHAVLVGHGEDNASARRAGVQEALAGALAEEPIGVTFADGTLRMVYPKSYHALAWLDSLDRQYLAHAQAAAGVADLAHREDYAVHALAPLVGSLAVRLWLWIITHKEPGLPFDETSIESATPPEWTTTVAPEDLVKVWQAHVEIHQQRLAIIARAFPSETAGSGGHRLPLAGFIGALAHESGQDARQLMRFHSLGKLFATSITAAEAVRDAQRRAAATSGASN